MLLFYDFYHVSLTINTDLCGEKSGNAQLLSSIVEVEKTCSRTSPKHSETSSSAKVLQVSSSTASDSSTKVDDLSISKIMEESYSTSVVVNMRTPQNQTKTLELEEKSSSTTKDMDCDIKDEKALSSQHVSNTDTNNTFSMTIEKEERL